MTGILLHLLPHLLAALAYAGLGVHFWHTRWRETGKSMAAAPMRSWERAAIAGALLLHAAGLYFGLFDGGGLHFSFGLALSLMMWLAVLIYWLESFLARMDGLQPMVLPLAAACALLPVLFPATRLVGHASDWGFKLHFLTAMLAYSLFTLSALHGIFMGYAESRLHSKTTTRSLASLPPLLTMEALLFRMIVVGFVLLTIALGSGAIYSEELFGRALSIDHKTLLAFASWAVFAVLLVGRYAWGWRGRTALRWTLVGFLMLLLAYIGSRFVLEVLLGRA